MDQITRCELHNTTFIAEEGSMFDRCFVCVFEENDRLKGVVDVSERLDVALEERSGFVLGTRVMECRKELYDALAKLGGEQDE